MSTVSADSPVTAIYSVSTLTLSGVSLAAVAGLAIDAQNNLFVADPNSNLILQITQLSAGSASVSLFFGGGATDYNTCTGSRLYSPYGVAVDGSGTLYVSERYKSAIRYADCSSSPGVSAEYGTVGDVTKSLSAPRGIALSGSDLYVADTGNHKIRRITNTNGHSGITDSYAGTTRGYVDGAAAQAAFSSPSGVAIAPVSGNVYVTDTNNCAIRMIKAGQVSTFAGAGPTSCGSSDGTGVNAQFDHPTGIATDAHDNLYVADSVSNKIRRITPQGVVSTIAGTGMPGSDDGLGSYATFNSPTGIVVNASGEIFVVDAGTNKIRKITLRP